MVISKACSSETWRTMAGMVVLPAAWDARQRRSPMMSWYRPPASSRTTTGCTTPVAAID